MFAPCIHLTAGLHAPLDQPHGRAHGAKASQRLHDAPAGIAHDLRQFDQTALRVVPGKQDQQPVLQRQAQEFGIPFTQHTPVVTGVPLVHLRLLFPQLIQPFHLPAFAQQHSGLFKAQHVLGHIRDQHGPIRQPYRLFRDRLPTAPRILQ